MYEQQSAMLQRLGPTGSRSDDDYLRSAREVLQQLIGMPNLLNHVELDRQPAGYSRNLLFGDDRTSIWALLWAPGAATPIHDHHCACCFGVMSGSIRELRFDPIGGGGVIRSTAHDRLPGFVTAMMPTGSDIHQMFNASDQQAVSIHIYGYDHRAHASSVHREYLDIAEQSVDELGSNVAAKSSQAK